MFNCFNKKTFSCTILAIQSLNLIFILWNLTYSIKDFFLVFNRNIICDKSIGALYLSKSIFHRVVSFYRIAIQFIEFVSICCFQIIFVFRLIQQHTQKLIVFLRKLLQASSLYFTSLSWYFIAFVKANVEFLKASV